jgi:hypothetical protein
MLDEPHGRHGPSMMLGTTSQHINAEETVGGAVMLTVVEETRSQLRQSLFATMFFSPFRPGNELRRKRYSCFKRDVRGNTRRQSFS